MQNIADLHPGFATVDTLPRARLSSVVTPIEALPNLSAALGNTALLVKRDDLAPLGLGGNKVRQLEFHLGRALAEGCDTVLVTGAVQSNFVRLTAAAACRLGLACHVQLEERVARVDRAYRESGNVLLDRLFGAVIHRYPLGEDEAGADRALAGIAARLRAEGATPHVITLGPGHPPVGALGYVDGARELVAQLAALGASPNRVVLASGSGATHAGLLVGLRLAGSMLAVTGVCVRRRAKAQWQRVRDQCRDLAELLRIDDPVADDDIVLTDAFLAPGYGRPGAAAREALRLAARHEGLLVDPVYTAKSLAEVVRLARQGADGPLLFLHTGGVPALFAYADELFDDA